MAIQVQNVSQKRVSIVKRVTVGKPVRKINPATTSIDNLAGVDTSTKENGYILVYNSSTEKWESVDNQAATNLGGINDVEVSTRVDGSILVYNETTEQWESKIELEKQTINGGQY